MYSSPESVVAQPTPPVRPPLGLSLRGIRQIFDIAGGRSVLEGKPIWWLQSHVVAPATSGRPWSMAEWASTSRVVSTADVGPATVYVSFSSKYPALRMLDALAAWETAEPEKTGPFFFYIDLFSEIQEQDDTLVVSFDELRDRYTRAICAARRTILVLDWREPAALRRAWPMFEIATTRARGFTFCVALAPDDEARFQHSLHHDFDSLVEKFCMVDAAAAQAFQKTDHDKIHRTIAEQYGGHLALNQLIVAAIKQWMVSKCEQALRKAEEDSPQKLSLLRSAARLNVEVGHLAEAESQLRSAHAVAVGLFGNTSPEAIDASAALARLLQSRGLLDEAESLCGSALRSARLGLGEDDVCTIAAATVMAQVLQAKGRLEAAQDLHADCFKRLRARFGDEHASALACKVELAQLLQLRGNLSEARSLFQEAEAACRALLIKDHPLWLKSAAGLAGALMADGDEKAATLLCSQVLLSRRRVLGDDHPDTLDSVGMLAGLTQAAGRMDEAGDLYREAAEGRRVVLGAAHPATLISLLDHARFLQAWCKVDEALPLVDAAAGALGAVLATEESERQFMAALAHAHRISEPARVAAESAHRISEPARLAAAAAAPASASSAAAGLTEGDSAVGAEHADAGSVRRGSASVPAPKSGLALAALDAVVKIAGGAAVLHDKSTDWLKSAVVKPFSLPHRCCMADALLMEELVPADAIGPANVFVSHAYYNNFLQAVEALRDWESRQPPGSGPYYYYFDLLVVNQHDQSKEVAFEVLRDEFAAGVRSAGRLLLLLDWPHRQPLGRLWVIFEIVTAMRVGASFHAVVMPGQKEAFDADLLRNFRNTLAVAVSINAGAADAAVDADRVNIRALVTQQFPDGGFAKVDAFVGSAVRAWLMQRFLWSMQSRVQGVA